MNEAQIKTLAMEARQKWLDDNFGSKKQIEAWVSKKMDGGTQEILLRLMGFERSYSDSSHWRIDHCNNRSGNSPIGDYLSGACRMALEKWVKDSMGSLPTLDTKTVLELHDEYKKKLREAVLSKMKIAAEQKAEAIVKDLVGA